MGYKKEYYIKALADIAKRRLTADETAKNNLLSVYLAHPDMAGYNYSDEAIEREYLRLCEGAKALDIPLEINLLGVRDHRWYPDERLFKIAAGVGNKVVVGLDAHTPEAFSHKRSVLQAEEMVKTLGLNLVEKPL